MSWFLAFAGFAALIVLHEFGHFIVAKAVGMRVERFMLFFPPVIWSFRRGETEYGIGAIPLGGYVRISGMNPREELPPEVEDRAYYRQKPWKRIAVILAGPAMNVVIAFALLWGIFVFHGQGTGESTTTIEAITPKSAADGVLADGDRLVSVDGVRGNSLDLRLTLGTHTCLSEQVDGCEGTPAKVTFVRDGRTMTATLRPRYSAEAKRPLLGFSFGERTEKLGAGKGATESVAGMWRVTKATVSAIGKLFYDSKARKEVSGVVGSYETTRQAVVSSPIDALQILALISLSLAIVNLFPFLPLDGGHVFWALAEKVRGRPIPFTVMERAGIIGFLLVGFLFIIGLTNDIDRLRGEGFGIR
ncbi:MAG: M50 family metallopeptidase [Solirubrobacteraceae bacterium]